VGIRNRLLTSSASRPRSGFFRFLIFLVEIAIGLPASRKRALTPRVRIGSVTLKYAVFSNHRD
jgi:hypothetical protein